MELRWRQLNSIIRMAIGAGLPTVESNDGDMIVYERWAKLRNLMNWSPNIFELKEWNQGQTNI